MRKFFYIFIGFCALTLLSCNKNKNTTTPSSVAKLSAFSFAAVDSMPGLAKAVFTVEERLDTGLVWNRDSMLYGTDLHHVVPRFTFAATPGASSLIMPDTVCQLTGYDTLDFTKQPIYLFIRSADKSNTKIYEIRPTVHQADPDLYIWTQLTDNMYNDDYASNDLEQRVVELGTNFVLISSNGFSLRADQSADGATWTKLGTPSGLPGSVKVRQIISDGTTLYYGQGNTIYTSTDAVNWTANSVSEYITTMLLFWSKHVWVLVDQGGQYELAWYDNGALNMTGIVPTGPFPVSDFAALTFKSASGRERAMILGGFADNGESLNTRWNLEYTQYLNDSTATYRIEEFAISRPQFTSMTGISVVWYNKEMLLFGGVDEKMSYLGGDIFVSVNEGMSWAQADTTKNQLPTDYRIRQKQSAIVRDNYIYVFGGQNTLRSFSDVYRGKLNSIDW